MAIDTWQTTNSFAFDLLDPPIRAVFWSWEAIHADTHKIMSLCIDIYSEDRMSNEFKKMQYIFLARFGSAFWLKSFQPETLNPEPGTSF